MAEEAQNEGQSGEDEAQREESSAKHLEVFQGNDDQWYYHAKAGNGDIVADAGGYNTRENAVRAAEDAFPGITATVTTVVNEGGDEAEQPEATPPENAVEENDAERSEALPTEAELADEMAIEEEAGQTRADEEADAEGNEA